MTRLTARQRGYTSRWDRARLGFLRSHPWCRWCADQGQQVRALHVHHSTPHKGDQRLFWDRSKWIGLCSEHHNGRAQQQERHGYHGEVSAAGLPLDPHHPFNRS